MRNPFREVPTLHLRAAALGACAGVFLLCGYEAVRSASNTLYKAAYGAERLPLIMAIMPLGVMVSLYVYGRFLSAKGPRVTWVMSNLVAAVLLATCFAAIESGSVVATGVLYIVREVYVMLVLEQIWSFINSVLSPASARRLNGPICGIASFGSISGGLLTRGLAQRIGTNSLLLIGVGSLLPTAWVGHVGHMRCGEPSRPITNGAHQVTLGLGEFRMNPMLVYLLLIVMMTQVMSTVLALEFQTKLQIAMPDPDRQTAYSGLFFASLNTVAGLLQFLVAPLLLRMISLRSIHTVIPLIHLITCIALLSGRGLHASAVAYLGFKALDYSLFRSAKEIAYIPLSFDVRYRVKEVIDVFGYRFAKGSTSLALTVFQWFGFAIQLAYGWVALVSAMVWLTLIKPFTRRVGDVVE